ncbi:hypothetical protein G9A89_016239 [Geosiphon pyriformis]|nr:hypothetical protein G9A89_016239 [Geosiphon pyriformis]
MMTTRRTRAGFMENDRLAFKISGKESKNELEETKQQLEKEKKGNLSRISPILITKILMAAGITATIFMEEEKRYLNAGQIEMNL